MEKKLGIELSLREADVLFGATLQKFRIGQYRVERNGQIVTVFSDSGQAVGKITLNPSGDDGGTLWLKDRLAGQFSHSGRNWVVFPIENGKRSSNWVKVSPISYLIAQIKAHRKISKTSNGA